MRVMFSFSHSNKKRIPWLRRLLLAAVGVFLGVSLYLANAQGIVRNRMPTPFGYGAAIVLSGSMEPALRVDDLVIVRETDQAALGDIVVYQSGEVLVVHRVTGFEGDNIITRGDANNVEDAPVPKTAVKGVVAYRVPGGGRAVRALRTPWAMLAVLALTTVLVELPRCRPGEDRAKIAELKKEIRQLRAQSTEENNNTEG